MEHTYTWIVWNVILIYLFFYLHFDPLVVSNDDELRKRMRFKMDNIEQQISSNEIIKKNGWEVDGNQMIVQQEPLPQTGNVCPLLRIVATDLRLSDPIPF